MFSGSVSGTTTEPVSKRGKNCQQESLSIYTIFLNSMGGEQCGINITEEQLLEVAELSDVLEDSTDDYLKPAVRRECERHLPDTDDIQPNEAKDAYLYLKSRVDKNIF